MAIVRGVTFRETWTLGENLAGYSVRAAAKRRAEDAEPAFDLAPILSDPAGGIIRIELSRETTGSLPAGRYVMDLILTRPDGTDDPPLAKDLPIMVRDGTNPLPEPEPEPEP